MAKLPGPATKAGCRATRAAALAGSACGSTQSLSEHVEGGALDPLLRSCRPRGGAGRLDRRLSSRHDLARWRRRVPMTQRKAKELGFSVDRLERMTETLQARINAQEIPGLVMIVMRRGEVAYLEALGFRDREAAALMAEERDFRIASLTKPLTSMAAMMLVEEGQLSLADPMSLYLPQLGAVQEGVVEPDGTLRREPPRRPITILDLLRHTSGFTYAFLGNSPVKQLYASEKVADAALSRADWTRQALGAAIAVASGFRVELQRLDRCAGSRHRDDLRDGTGGIHREAHHRSTRHGGHRVCSAGSRAPADCCRQVDPASGSRPPMRDIVRPPARFGGGGEMVSTAPDYARFCQFWLERGTVGSTRLLSRKSIELMTSDALPPGISGLIPRWSRYLAPSPESLWGKVSRSASPSGRNQV